MFYELRQYRIKDGRRDEFAQLLSDTMIPFQASQGMVIVGAFKSKDQDDLIVWIRRFENEEQKEKLYEKVYQSEFWKTRIIPLCDEMLDRPRMEVTILENLPVSVI